MKAPPDMKFGDKRIMKCVCVDGTYQYHTTVGKLYEVELVEGIFDTRPFFKYVNDNGNVSHCHTYRFEEIEDGQKQNHSHDSAS